MLDDAIQLLPDIWRFVTQHNGGVCSKPSWAKTPIVPGRLRYPHDKGKPGSRDDVTLGENREGLFGVFTAAY